MQLDIMKDYRALSSVKNSGHLCAQAPSYHMAHHGGRGTALHGVESYLEGRVDGWAGFIKMTANTHISLLPGRHLSKCFSCINPALMSSSCLQGTSRHRKVKQLAQNHTASKWLSQDLNSERLHVCALSCCANLPHKKRPGCPIHVLARQAVWRGDFPLHIPRSRGRWSSSALGSGVLGQPWALVDHRATATALLGAQPPGEALSLASVPSNSPRSSPEVPLQGLFSPWQPRPLSLQK